MTFNQKAAMFLATAGHIGYSPFAPGTLGSLIGIPLCFLLAQIKLAVAVIAVLLTIVLAVWISNSAEKTLKRRDPGCIVIDEIAGMMVTLIGVPLGPAAVIIGFTLFRILDILKPFPIRIIDRRLSGGFGIVADDVVAGLLANIATRILLLIIGRY